VPDQLEFFGDAHAQVAFGAAIERLQALGGTPVTIDYAPLAAAADLLYNSALVAERYAAVRPFFDAHAGQVIEPVRSILAQGRDYSAADFVDAQTRLRVLAQQAAPMWREVELLLLPTAPTHYTIEAMRADPALRDVRVLLMTARGSVVERRRGLELGADGFIAKPFELGELRAEMARLLGAA